MHEAIANPFGHGEFKLAARYHLGKALRQRQYDQAIVLPNSWKSALVPFFAGIAKRTGYRGEMRRGLLNDVRKLDKDKLPLMVERFVALADSPDSPLPNPIPQPKLNTDEQHAPFHTEQARPEPGTPDCRAMRGRRIRPGQTLAGSAFCRTGEAAARAGLSRYGWWAPPRMAKPVPRRHA